MILVENVYQPTERKHQLPLFAPVDLAFCLATPGFGLAFMNFEPVLNPVLFLPVLFPLFLLLVGSDMIYFLNEITAIVPQIFPWL